MKELGNEEDMDDFFASGVHGGSEVGIDAKHLSKVWQISYEDAKWTIDATTQHGTHLPNPAVNQNYTTNDRMLWNWRINQYFFMDTFFATRKVAPHPEATHIVNCSSWTRALSTLCP